MSNPSANQQDVPPILALLGLIVVVGAYLILQAPAATLHWLNLLDLEYTMQTVLIWITGGALALNLMTFYSILSRWMGLNQQGSRLAVMTGRKAPSFQTSWRTLFVSLAGGIFAFACLLSFGYPTPRQVFLLELAPAANWSLLLSLRLNFATSFSILLWFMGRLPIWKELRSIRERELPEMPKPANSIVLGSLGDDRPDERPSWVISNRKALNGNILITGSVGAGKTQGTVLSYFSQAIANFNPRPAILAIDPKGTFIPIAREIIEKHGLSKHVLHIRLGGNVTFNPIYSPRSLKEGRFLDTAQMIRAAAVNFMGKSFDSPFWEISAFNLIKNCLVLCGAKYAA